MWASVWPEMRSDEKASEIMSEGETRAELFAALRGLSEIVPEMRAGQLKAAVGELCSDLHGRGLWDASDTELLEAVWQFRRDFEPGGGRTSLDHLLSISFGYPKSQDGATRSNCLWT